MARLRPSQSVFIIAASPKAYLVTFLKCLKFVIKFILLGFPRLSVQWEMERLSRLPPSLTSSNFSLTLLLSAATFGDLSKS